MVNIFCDAITKELIVVALQISHTQNDVVRLVAPTETLEVKGYEEAPEVQEQEDKGTKEAQEEQH